MRTINNTLKISILATLCALSVVLATVVRFPLFPSAPYLEFDAGDVAILVGTFMYGPLSGVLITLIVSLIQGVTVSAASGLWGILMHFVSTSFFCIVCGYIYHRRANRIILATALLTGVVFTTILMIPLNLIITPLYTGAPQSFVASILIPTIIPFNLIKFAINAILAFGLWSVLELVIKNIRGKKNVG